MVIQDNQVALGTDRTCSFPGDFAQLGGAYGMPVHRVDGNNVLDMYAATRLAVDHARRGDGPVMIVARTFRMGGHATHDEREARDLFPAEVFAYWGQRDPVGNFEAWLQAHRGVEASTLAALEARIEAEIDEAARDALAKRATHEPLPETVTHGVYAASSER